MNVGVLERESMWIEEKKEDEFKRDFSRKGKIMDEICEIYEKFEGFRKDLTGE